MTKRGQITAFIIIGIVVLAIVAFVAYFRQAGIEEMPREAVDGKVKPIQIFVEECIQKTAVPGIYQLGLGGGSIGTGENDFMTEFHSISFGFSDNEEKLPSVNEMEKELSSYLKQFLPICTDNLSKFEEEGMTIEEGDISIETRIFQKEVVFLVDYPLKISKGDDSYEMKNFMAKVPVRLGKTHNIAKKIIQENKGKGFSANSMLIPEVSVNLLPAASDNLVFALLDEKSNINNRSFVFQFAYEINPNKNPQIYNRYNPMFKSGERIEFSVNASDPEMDKLRFSSNSTIFSPNPDTGKIITTAPPPGVYRVNFIVTDGEGGKDEKSIVFNIVEEAARADV